MNKSIKDFTDVELKAAAYDALATIEMCQGNIKAINEELRARNTPPVNEPLPETKDEAIVPEKVSK